MTTVTEIIKADGELLVRGKLKLVEIHGKNQWINKDGKIVSPIIVAEKEFIGFGDLVWNIKNNRIEKSDNSRDPQRKILALPEKFSPDRILDIKDGKLNDGDHVYLVCRNDANINDAPIYKIKLTQEKYITMAKNVSYKFSDLPKDTDGESIAFELIDKEIVVTQQKKFTGDLHKDVSPYLCAEEGKIFPTLNHPFVYCDPYFYGLTEYINKEYEQKKKAIEKAKIECDYYAYVFLHERYYRLRAFKEISEWLPDADYYKLLSDIWINSEDISEQKELWWDCLMERSVTKRHFMNDDEKRVFNELPNKIKVYRGYVPAQNKFGFSFTLDKNKAEGFAKRFNSKGKVWARTVSKDEVFAYVDRRGEKEIIITTKEKPRN